MAQKTLSYDEVAILTGLSYSKNDWLSDDITTIKVDYDAEYQDFLVETDEKKTRRNRISKTQMDVTAWADGQIKSLTYQGKTVSAFTLTITKDNVTLDLSLAVKEQPSETVVSV